MRNKSIGKMVTNILSLVMLTAYIVCCIPMNVSAQNTDGIPRGHWVDETETVHHGAEGHYEDVQVGTKTVVDKEAWDEPVYEWFHVCNECGEVFDNDNAAGEHDVFVHDCQAGYHGEIFQVDTIHHDAVTHEEAVYETQWIEDRAAWDEEVPTGNKKCVLEDGSTAVDTLVVMDGGVYYIDEDGVMATGLTDIEGGTSVFDESGKRLYGWQTTNLGKVYADPETGYLVKGTSLTIDGEKYYFEDDGKLHTEHKWSDTYTVDKKASCTEDGSESIHCEVCGAVKEGSSRVIPKGHKYGEWKVTKAATCTAGGIREKVCTVCGNKVTEEIPATGHKWNTAYTVDKKATSTQKGSESIHCSVCDAVKEGSSREIPKLNGSWRKNSKGWWYGWSDGSYLKNCFENIGGKIYYFNGSGYMVTSWQRISGKWYYFDANGAMKTGWQKIRNTWYYMDDDGVMQTGLQTIGNTKYYFTGSGAMKTGWQKIGDVWYYFTGSGAMKTGWLKSGSTWYYMGSNGAMKTGWQKIGGGWYYFTGSGAMKTGWLKSGSTWYYMGSNGAMKTGWQKIGSAWYYFIGSGAMQTGWQKIGGAWYYFTGGGAMAASRWVGNYYLTEGGKMAVNRWVGKYYVGADGKWIPGYKAVN